MLDRRISAEEAKYEDFAPFYALTVLFGRALIGRLASGRPIVEEANQPASACFGYKFINQRVDLN